MFAAIRRTKQLLARSSEPGWLLYLPSAVQFSLLVLFVAGYSSHNLYRPTWYMLAALVAAAALILQPKPHDDVAPENEGVQRMATA
jgi:hypothetical protein